MSTSKNHRWVYPLFNSLLLMSLPLVGAAVLVRWRHRVFSRGSEHWNERWGKLQPETEARLSGDGRVWWVHAVSLGEVKAIEAFLRKVPRVAGATVVLTVVTPEALAWAAEHRVADVVLAAPIDLPWIVRRVMRKVRPEVFISVESEFWPNLLREAKRVDAKVILINGRISERSFASYGRIRPILAALWEIFDLFCVRHAEDAQRFIALGVPPVKIHVTGNLKYDLYTERRAQKRGAMPVVVMGSTREGEESQLLPSLERVRRQFPQLRVIWAPRHIERMGELEDLLKSKGLEYQRISELRQRLSADAESPYVLWDSMGDLLDAYRQADVAVVGGSFVPKGGQNPIEPAALRLPVLFGPSMDNFQGIAESLLKSGGARRVSAEDLDQHLTDLLKNPEIRQAMGERAQQAVIAEQGATDRTLQLIMALK